MSLREPRYAVALRESWNSRGVYLLVFDRMADNYLAKDGTWKHIDEGAVFPDDDMFVLPRDSIETLAQACDIFLGHTSHADTEARVLREWLAVEQARVNRVLGNP
jgi:hypothetical protein